MELSSEAARDRVPVFRQYRDLSAVNTATLEDAAEKLVRAINRHGFRRCRQLYVALVDIESELASRGISVEPVGGPVRSLPASNVVRIFHRNSPFGSGWLFHGGGA